MPAGRPRHTLPGGHRKRKVPPTQDAKVRQAVRELAKKPEKKASREPAGKEHREARKTKDGRTLFILKKGHHQGRPPGAKNKIPKGIRPSIKAILEKVVKEKGATVESAIVDGISSGPRHADRYLRLAAEYVDGKPTDNVNLNARFNQDELGMAREQLGKKLDGMLKIILSKEASSE